MRHITNFHTVATEEIYVTFRHLSDLKLQWCIIVTILLKTLRSFPKHTIRTNSIVRCRFHCTCVRISRYAEFLDFST
jgi:hypothetical protein